MTKSVFTPNVVLNAGLPPNTMVMTSKMFADRFAIEYTADGIICKLRVHKDEFKKAVVIENVGASDHDS